MRKFPPQLVNQEEEEMYEIPEVVYVDVPVKLNVKEDGSKLDSTVKAGIAIEKKQTNIEIIITIPKDDTNERIIESVMYYLHHEHKNRRRKINEQTPVQHVEVPEDVFETDVEEDVEV